MSEKLETLFEGRDLRIERIVSRGHASPPGFWYDSDEGEWVMLLSGAAEVRFEEEGRRVKLAPGDHLHIRPHERHRVEWTQPDADTVWLAVHHRE
ncbi:MAG: cupin domain-containing protein [Candidatus Eiseniibacteriota bacterium]